MEIDDECLARVAQFLPAVTANDAEEIQALWSNYGSLMRFTSKNGNKSLIAKWVKHEAWSCKTDGDSTKNGDGHKYGWNSSIGHQRKCRSYQVEQHWYSNQAKHCQQRIPQCLWAGELSNGDYLMILEDLDQAGYAGRQHQLSVEHMLPAIRWLAGFHAQYCQSSTTIAQQADGLWQQGNYWHLATRPEEFEQLQDPSLREHGPQWDQLLRDCPIQTLIHGDAKLANMCFPADPTADIAMLDFQYVGPGLGVQDLAYFVSSCLDEQACAKHEDWILDNYFTELGKALAKQDDTPSIEEVEALWRPLYAVAWADFLRFLQGWCPGHYKVHAYSCQQATAATQLVTMMNTNNR